MHLSLQPTTIRTTPARNWAACIIDELSFVHESVAKVFDLRELLSKKNENSDSDRDENDDEIPQISCQIMGYKYHLHTHAPVANVLYHLRMDELTGSHHKMQLNEHSGKWWQAFQKQDAKKALKTSLVFLLGRSCRMVSNAV